VTTEPASPGGSGRTYQDSVPAWPDLPAGLGGPFVMIVSMTRLLALRLLRLDARHRTSTACGGGLRYTGFHTTALCSPSRACLLTGRNHHSVGMRRCRTGTPASRTCAGGITPRPRRWPSCSCPRVRDLCGGEVAPARWRRTSAAARTPTGRCRRARPLLRFLQGETDQFFPELTTTTTTSTRPGGSRRLPRERGHRRALDRLGPRPRLGPTRPSVLLVPGLRRHSCAPSVTRVVPGALARQVRRGLRRGRASASTSDSSSSGSSQGHHPCPAQPRRAALGRLDRRPKGVLVPPQEAFAAMLEHTTRRSAALSSSWRKRGGSTTRAHGGLDNGASREAARSG